MQTKRPRLALTMGDVAGIGPEVIARALAAPEVAAIAPVVVGHPEQALALVDSTRSVLEIDSLGAALPESEAVACFNPGADDVLAAPRGRNDARRLSSLSVSRSELRTE
jgi:4-hydroxythreonine-4-phosphate dehydrogenase